MIITQPPSYKCSKCRGQFDTEIEDFDTPERYNEPRNMGDEIQYIWTLEITCPKCDNDLKIVVEGYEYPEGFYNYHNTESEGCLILKDAKVQVDIRNR